MTESTRAAKHAAARLKVRLSKVLWAELERLDLTVSELARRANLPQRTAAEYAAGATEPSLSRALALERACGRPPGWLSRQVAAEPAGEAGKN